MSSQKNYHEKIQNYHEQVKMLNEKKQILKSKEERVTKMKEDILSMNIEANQLDRKLKTVDFLLTSSAEEQSQMKKALSKDRYSETLCSKLHNVNLDLKQHFEHEIKHVEKLSGVYEEMMRHRRLINEQRKYMGHLKEDIHEGSIRANATRKLLYED